MLFKITTLRVSLKATKAFHSFCEHKGVPGVLWQPHKSRWTQNLVLMSSLMILHIDQKGTKNWFTYIIKLMAGEQCGSQAGLKMAERAGREAGSVFYGGYRWTRGVFLHADRSLCGLMGLPKEDASSFLTSLLRCGQRGRGRMRLKSS